MKKEKEVESRGKQKREIKEEVLQGIAATPDYEIVRRVQEDGSVLYYHPIAFSDDPEPVKGESLHDVVSTPIRRVKALVGLLDDDDWSRFGFVAETIIEEAERLYDEVFHFLDEVVGEIEIDVMGRNSVVYRTGRVLGARIIPAKGKEMTS